MNTTKSMVLSMLCIAMLALLSFSKLEKNPANADLEDIDVIDLLTEQRYECRPSESYLFLVDSKLVKTEKGVNKINVKIFICDRFSDDKELLAEKNIKLEHFNNLKTMSVDSREILATTSKESYIYDRKDTPYDFYELMTFEPIYRGYLASNIE